MLTSKVISHDVDVESVEDADKQDYIMLRNLRQQYSNVHEDLYRWGRIGQLIRRVYSIVNSATFIAKEQDDLVAQMESASKEEVAEVYKKYRDEFIKETLTALKAPINFSREEQARVYDDVINYNKQEADILSKIKLLPEGEQ
jgi:hypothetical protein